jgi:hypothetical protein
MMLCVLGRQHASSWSMHLTHVAATPLSSCSCRCQYWCMHLDHVAAPVHRLQSVLHTCLDSFASDNLCLHVLRGLVVCPAACFNTSLPGLPLNATKWSPECNGIQAGQTCTAVCSANYTGSPTATCGANGTFLPTVTGNCTLTPPVNGKHPLPAFTCTTIFEVAGF